MARIQDVAFHLVAEHGFAAVTVEEIAAAADVSPATIYRMFGTKDAILLWDPFEDPVMEAIASALADGVPPLPAVRRGVAQVLEPLDPRREGELLDFVRFVFAEGPLREAAWARMETFHQGMAAMLERAGFGELEAAVLSASVVAVLWAGIDVWQRAPEGDRLSAICDRSLRVLGSLASIEA